MFISLTSVTFESEVPPTIATGMFEMCDVGTIYVPSEAAKALYEDVAALSDLKDKIQVKQG